MPAGDVPGARRAAGARDLRERQRQRAPHARQRSAMRAPTHLERAPCATRTARRILPHALICARAHGLRTVAAYLRVED